MPKPDDTTGAVIAGFLCLLLTTILCCRSEGATSSATRCTDADAMTVCPTGWRRERGRCKKPKAGEGGRKSTGTHQN